LVERQVQPTAEVRRLLYEVGPDGYIMAMGRAIPPDAGFENLKVMVDSVHR
jgi:uroporphyrinogen-III decarboxylase